MSHTPSTPKPVIQASPSTYLHTLPTKVLKQALVDGSIRLIGSRDDWKITTAEVPVGTNVLSGCLVYSPTCDLDRVDMTQPKTIGVTVLTLARETYSALTVVLSSDVLFFPDNLLIM
jgi:hypothetical protein